MWSRFVILSLCCLAVANCIPESDRAISDVKNFGTGSDTTAFGDRGESTSQNERQTFNFAQHGSQDNKFNGGSTFGRPVGGSNQNFNNRESETRPGSLGRPTGEFGQSSNNRENNQHSTASRPNNQEHFSSQSTGGSNHNTIHKEGENLGSSGSRPSNTGDSSFGRPTGSSGHRESENRPSVSRPSSTGDSSFGSNHNTINKEGENRPSGSRPSNIGNVPFGRPTGGSSHTTDHREGENRPSGSRPSSGDSSFGRPTGGSSHTTDHREGENLPTGSRPSNTGDVPFGRPTGGSSHTTDHREGENRPSGSRPSSGDNSFGRPTGGLGHITDQITGSSGSRPGISNQQHGRPTGESGFNQQTGFRPDNQEGTNQRPGSQQNTGDSSSGLNQFSNNETDSSNNSGTEGGKPGKEEEEDVCFTHLGCFKMGKPWKTTLRPIGAPHGPEKIQTTIHFYSRNNLEHPKKITLYPQVDMGEAQFDPSKITAMIVHGFSNSGNATWMKDMKNVYLKKVDANLMIVDWGKGAQLLNYFQVAGNTRVVGKQLGVFVKFLIDKFGADPGKFHLIGHSLGAQISSYLGKEVQGIARLTALDPAQPAFEGFDREVRLDKNDAEFVDVIHTDARPFIPTLGFGMITPHGHVDFYMNGGFDQPGCVPPSKKEIPAVKNVLDLAKFPVEVIARTVACPHARAYEYLIEAFNETENCIFWGHKADVKNVFKSVTNTLTQGLLKKFTALSTTCSKEDCIPLGFATKKSPLRGVFVVTTNGRSPYCISEPGIPPETAPQERKHESFIQKIGKKARGTN